MDAAGVQGLLDEAVREHGVPGAQLGLQRGGDRVVLCSGDRDLRGPGPVLPTTAFHAGSVAKGLCGLVVLGAARAGDLDLDVPCSEQAEGLWSDPPRRLLTQTSGRPNLLPEPDEDLERFVDRVGSMPLLHEPGRFSYCNPGWSELDLLLRRTTGRGFEELAEQLLPLDLTFGRPDGAAAGHEVAPGRAPVEVPPTDLPAATAAGGRWWVTADDLLDVAVMHLAGAPGVHSEDLRALSTPAATLPGSTVFDAWGMGWAVWERGAHRAFGWAGYTDGHRAFLRCFPDQQAAVVLLANAAGPLFGSPGGTAVFDALLPDLLEVLGVPPLADPVYEAGPVPPSRLAGRFGPLLLEPGVDDELLLHAQPLGAPDPMRCTRLGGNTFDVAGYPPGSTPFAVDGDVLYLGPFAMPRG